jgi:hypothetical protein
VAPIGLKLKRKHGTPIQITASPVSPVAGAPCLAFRDVGLTRDRGTAVISAAGLRAYFSHERLTICTSVMVMCPCSVLPFFT